MKRHLYGAPFVFATKIGEATMCARPARPLCADQLTPHDVAGGSITSGENLWRIWIVQITPDRVIGDRPAKLNKLLKKAAKTYGPYTEGGWVRF